MGRINILFFSSDYKIGLSSLLVEQLISLNKISKLNVFPVSGEKEQEINLFKKIKYLKNTVSIIDGLDNHSNFFVLAGKISRLIIENQIQIVHVQNNWQLILIGFIKIKFFFKKKINIIYTIHGFRHNHHFKSLLARYFIGLSLLLLATRVIYMSNYVKSNFSFLNFKMTKIYLGIDNIFFEKSKNNIVFNELNLIFPAQFRYGKGQDIIIRSFARYVKETKDSNSKLYLPGSGDLKSKIETLAIHLGVWEQVVFPGHLSKFQLRELYEYCNVGIISSNSETFGQSIAEIFVSGRCLVSRDVGIASEVIKVGQNGFLFDNENDLFEILIQLKKNPKLVIEAGDLNFNNRNIFSWNFSSSNYLKLIEKLSD